MLLPRLLVVAAIVTNVEFQSQQRPVGVRFAFIVLNGQVAVVQCAVVPQTANLVNKQGPNAHVTEPSLQLLIQHSWKSIMLRTRSTPLKHIATSTTHSLLTHTSHTAL